MKDCRNYGRYPFCKQCKNTGNSCPDYATYSDEETFEMLREQFWRERGVVLKR